MKTSDQTSMAAYMDRRIEKGGHIEQIAADTKSEAERRKSWKGGEDTTYDSAYIRGHIQFRLTQDKDWLKDRNLKVDGNRIVKIKQEGSKP